MTPEPMLLSMERPVRLLPGTTCLYPNGCWVGAIITHTYAPPPPETVEALDLERWLPEVG